MIPATLPHFIIGNELSCVYCGEPPSVKDHVIPVSYSSPIDDPHCRGSNFGPTAHACKYCNTQLYNRFFDTFDARCQWMHEFLNERTAAIVWTQEEIAGLDHKLKTFVKHRIQRSRWMRMRADWYESRDYLLCLEHLLWQPELDRYNPKANPFLVSFFHDTLSLVRLVYNRDFSSAKRSRRRF